MKCGIFGASLAGKSTLFRLLTNTINDDNDYAKQEIRIGLSEIPDDRLEKIAVLQNSRKVVFPTFEYLDFPGSYDKDSNTEPIPTKYLAELRTVDVILLVIRKFTNPMVPEPPKGIIPLNDLIDTNLEFIISDLQVVEKRLERARKQKYPLQPNEIQTLEKCLNALSAEKALRCLDWNGVEYRLLKSFSFLSLKPMLVVVNVSESDILKSDQIIADLKANSKLDDKNVNWAVSAAKLEEEIWRLNDDDQQVFLADTGISKPTILRVTQCLFELMDLIVFLTAGPKESRAWVMRSGSSALEAAAQIHNDIARGFIRAEVCRWDELVEAGSYAKLKEKGKMRLEGRDYLVKDGDVLNIRFNV